MWIFYPEKSNALRTVFAFGIGVGESDRADIPAGIGSLNIRYLSQLARCDHSSANRDNALICHGVEYIYRA